MPGRYLPTLEALAKHTTLLLASVELIGELIEAIPAEAYLAVSDALGLIRCGAIQYERENASILLTDCCIHDWRGCGKNVVEMHADSYRPVAGSDEEILLNGYLNAQYAMLAESGRVPGMGIYCGDAAGNELFLMDQGLSRGLASGWEAFATRIIPVGDFCIAGGAILPVLSRSKVEATAKRIARRRLERSLGVIDLDISLLLARSCLEASIEAAYPVPQKKSALLRRMPRQRRPPGRDSTSGCGSP